MAEPVNVDFATSNAMPVANTSLDRGRARISIARGENQNGVTGQSNDP
jgi:hypothetical protein